MKGEVCNVQCSSSPVPIWVVIDSLEVVPVSLIDAQHSSVAVSHVFHSWESPLSHFNCDLCDSNELHTGQCRSVSEIKDVRSLLLNSKAAVLSLLELQR